ncbi:putative toxoplasma gondii family C protein [Toxoplasma gondii GT1]|uniref:Putative toxoplasma gondii family C protein n=1 Tax=Toxoplasma gondii (strain ATCC 50853 / GT1) TaxID=507601 RepID=S7UG48_TOXGG|nr:putative toxoplasma gondii family C protein [Toxoplasma gondii GT1]
MRAQFYSLASIMLAVLLGTIFLNSGRNLRKATTPASSKPSTVCLVNARKTPKRVPEAMLRRGRRLLGVVRMQIAMHDDGRLEAQGLDIRRSLRTIHAREGLHLMCVVPIFMDPSPPGYSGVLDVRVRVPSRGSSPMGGLDASDHSVVPLGA